MCVIGPLIQNIYSEEEAIVLCLFAVLHYRLLILVVKTMTNVCLHIGTPIHLHVLPVQY